MKTLSYTSAIAAIGLLTAITVGPAFGQGFQVHRHCTSSQFAGTTCRTTVVPLVAVEPTAEELAAKATRIAQWEAYCQPKRTYDNEGVIRLVYAKRGCEFGRSED